MSSLDKLIEGTPETQSQPNVVSIIRSLGCNKDLRIFLTALCKYSKSDWAKLIRNCRLLYSVMQSSLLIKNDSELAEELAKIPHFAIFFRRITEEDV